VWDALREHLLLSAGAVAVACVIALPIGIWFGHTGRGGGTVVALSNMTRAIPTYALLVIFVVASGKLGAPTVIPALAIFAIPPLLANAYLGLREVDPEVRDAAKGMGMSGWQLLRKVELPVALPLIMSGVRSAFLQVVATATIAAVVSLGGFGRYVIDGLSQQNYSMMVAGALLVALLAVIGDRILALIGHFVISPGLTGRGARRRRAAATTADMVVLRAAGTAGSG